jgi:hypothetical protein
MRLKRCEFVNPNTRQRCVGQAIPGWRMCGDDLAFLLGEAYAIVNSLRVEQDDEEQTFGEAACFFEERMGLPPSRR